MANLFDETDFTLFTQYQGKTKGEAPDGMKKLREMYDKLGMVLEILSKKGYQTQIIRNPLAQAGPGRMEYSDFHWSKIYPKRISDLKSCMDRAFIVLGAKETGVYLHIGANRNKGYDDDKNPVANSIKEKSLVTYAPKEASTYSCEEWAEIVEKYITEKWVEFNKFGKVFGVQECIDNLNKMDIKKTAEVLIANHNLILTGAPGTGKTYLAKEIAEGMGAKWKLVQFHPSYDYTDFVEGLRPIKKGSSLGFERKDGVFKKFCKDVIKEYDDKINEAIDKFAADVRANGSISIKYVDSKGSFDVSIGTPKSFKITIRTDSPQAATYDAIKEVIKTGKKIGQQTYSYCIGLYIKDMYLQGEPAPKVFIIDEINRGEISKIFGELFYSIDPGYRGKKGKVDTQYQNLIPKEGDVDFDPSNADVFRNGFYVPENVYIIGTMNDIDRSVESMDFAIRRRFAWKEITAESRQSMLEDEAAWNGMKPAQAIIDEIKVRMNNLNACIIDKYGDEELPQKDKIGLTPAYQIGASYFLKYGLYGNFDELWDNHLEGLLYEYLRGTTNIEAKIDRLKKAFNDTTARDHE